MDAAYFSGSVDDKIQIFTGFNNSSEGQAELPLILGQVDDVEIDLVGRAIILSGRDLSAQMIDTKTSDHFQQKTASEIVTIIAGRHGLTPNVQATTTRVGQYYEIDQTRLTATQPEWDLLIFLAEQEGFDLWVSGKTLNFQPPVDETSNPYLLRWSETGTKLSNCTELKLRRSQTLAKDVIVKIRSWHQAQGVPFTVQAKRTQAAKGQRSGGEAQTYFFTVANLTQKQAQQLANQRLEQITRHERVINANLPGDNLLTVRTPLSLSGTNTQFDQVYFVDSVKRTLTMNGGYDMEVRAKNSSTSSTVAE
jgi:phage protein D